METARMFNGVQVRAVVESQPGSTATTERNTLSSYELELTLKIKIPQAHHNLAALSQLNGKHQANSWVRTGEKRDAGHAGWPPFIGGCSSQRDLYGRSRDATAND